MSKDWEKELMDGLRAYTDEVTGGVKTAAEEVAKAAVEQLKKTSPRKVKGQKKGQYAKGWRVKKTEETATGSVVVVHNKTDYQLTHLLEHGHKNRDGSTTAARPHIAEAHDKAVKDFEDKITLVIKG